jgi:hypothetical protein
MARYDGLAELLNAIVDAGFALERVVEAGREDPPGLLALAARRAPGAGAGRYSAR